MLCVWNIFVDYHQGVRRIDSACQLRVDHGTLYIARIYPRAIADVAARLIDGTQVVLEQLLQCDEWICRRIFVEFFECCEQLTNGTNPIPPLAFDKREHIFSTIGQHCTPLTLARKVGTAPAG